MEKIFVYYSLSGNGDYVAEVMKSKGFDILKIEQKKKMPKHFFTSVLTGGFLAGINARSKLKNSEEELSKINEYEQIVIGSPVWNGRLSSPINTVIDHVTKPFELLMYSGSGKAQKVQKQLKSKPLKNVVVLVEPLKHQGDCKEAIEKNF